MAKKNRYRHNSEQSLPVQNQPAAEEAAPMPEQEIFEFDVWWVLRQAKIPAHHMKEVIKADMRARGVSDKETLECFDKALKDYGIK